jgi:hypothetical protein
LAKSNFAESVSAPDRPPVTIARTRGLPDGRRFTSEPPEVYFNT